MPSEVIPLWQLAQHGHLGVDLFFVLSGWLIGSLYWRELQDRRHVDVWNFWKRRWWRTLPAYYVALAMSWLAVFGTRGEPFDWVFLLFSQNYRDRIPFFLVSWSLCVEEHFYLAIPLVLAGWIRLGWSIHILFVSLLLAPWVLGLRMADPFTAVDFGFLAVASHLRMGGLLAGFWLAYIKAYEDKSWRRVCQWAPQVAVAALAATAVAVLHGGLEYAYINALVTLSFAATLAARVGRAPQQPSRVVRTTAEMSYSLYLTHALVIHVARVLAAKAPTNVANVLYLASVLPLIYLAGTAFFRFIEAPSLLWREKFAPQSPTRLTQPPATATGKLAAISLRPDDS